MSSSDPTATTHNSAEGAAGNFVRDLIAEHLSQGRYAGVVTRFPPEPNGYLHIGHAKAIYTDFHMAERFGGRCHLRLDDTNPLVEDTEYVESIKADIRWLGFDWGEHLYYASDYFERFYEFAQQLIKTGRAYVDSQSIDEIRANRGTVTAPGTPSPHRDRPIAESLDLLARMRAGEFPDGAHVVRAKIDMAHPNMQMRDPLLYRIRHAHHHRTGDRWCIYPMYDFAHCLSDALEGVTHSLCTLEFENNRDIYDWVLEAVGFQEPRPHQYEFARLALTYTITSKRKLRALVEGGHVSGWDDPRMPTLSAARRRGVPAAAIRAFIAQVGVAKTNSLTGYDQLEHVLRSHLNETAPRVMAVLDPLKVIIDNYPADGSEQLSGRCFPEDHPDDRTRDLPFSRELYIERADFMLDPPRRFYRLAPGREVRLRWGYFIKCVSVDQDEDGTVTAVHCTYDPDTRGGSAPDGRKVKATLHWVCARGGVPAEVRLYDRLFRVERPGAEGDFIADLNPDSLQVVTAVVEPAAAALAAGDRVQFERTGYFGVDPVDSRPGAPVFNRIVTLKDAWQRIQDKTAPAPAPKKPRKPKKQKQPKKRKPDAAALRAEKSPALAARFDRYMAELGLGTEDAHLLTDSAARADFFEAAVAAHDNPAGAANLINNALMATLKDSPVDALPFDGAALGELVRLLDEEVISSRIAKTVLDRMIAGEGAAAEIVAREGLQQISDPAALGALVDGVLAQHAEVVAQVRAGDGRRRGFLVGQIMRASGGQANPRLLQQILSEKLAAEG